MMVNAIPQPLTPAVTSRKLLPLRPVLNIVSPSNQRNSKTIYIVLSEGCSIVRVVLRAEAPWTKIWRIDTTLPGGGSETYLLKLCTGYQGDDAVRGDEFAASYIHELTPVLCPKPLGRGPLQKNCDVHFYLCRLEDAFPDANAAATATAALVLPGPGPFSSALARLHRDATSFNSMFGLFLRTCVGDLVQDNTWSDRWEPFFTHGLRHLLNVRALRAGHHAEFDDVLVPALLDKVVPRLLRPLETDGRSVKPALVHGNLWCGRPGALGGDPRDWTLYAPASFWGHNECELTSLPWLRPWFPMGVYLFSDH